ncbi:hypothetical protein LINGRAPRIM_LOCUS2039 [Linum grandiflorum]
MVSDTNHLRRSSSEGRSFNSECDLFEYRKQLNCVRDKILEDAQQRFVRERGGGGTLWRMQQPSPNCR